MLRVHSLIDVDSDSQIPNGSKTTSIYMAKKAIFLGYAFLDHNSRYIGDQSELKKYKIIDLFINDRRIALVSYDYSISIIFNHILFRRAAWPLSSPRLHLVLFEDSEELLAYRHRHRVYIL